MAVSPDRVYYVSEQSLSIRVKSVLIAKESEKAIMLQDTFIAAPLNRPKRVLMKGVDLIALTEKDALEHYLHQMRQQMVDLEFALVRAQQFIDYAVESKEELVKAEKLAKEEAPPPPVTGISTEFVSDHPILGIEI